MTALFTLQSAADCSSVQFSSRAVNEATSWRVKRDSRPDFIRPDVWPSDSADLNPTDYEI